MNKYFVVGMLIIGNALPIHASDHKLPFGVYTYAWNSQNPKKMIRTHLSSGKTETILVAPGQSQQEKIKQLMVQDFAHAIVLDKNYSHTKK